MSTSIDNAFIKQYEREVHVAYQRQGSKLRNTVRTKNNIVGESTTFQKVGKGTAAQKTRNGQVPQMNVNHTPVECLLADYYAGEMVDKLDELKTNIDEKEVLSNAGAYALGRKTDELIINALATTTKFVGNYSTGLTLPLLSQAIEMLNDADVPDDGQRFGVLSSHAWEEFKNIVEVGSGDYTGDLYPWLQGQQAFKWNGVMFMPHSGLPLASTDDRDCYIYHKTAVGHASGSDVKTDITWQGMYAAHFINNMMSQGACLIDTIGAVEIRVDDDTALT
jgi:hypothetical protein